MTYSYGSCESSKDKEIDKFLVFSCEGGVVDKAKTLKEAEVKADEHPCAFVMKILRICGDEADLDVFEEMLNMPIGSEVQKKPKKQAESSNTAPNQALSNPFGFSIEEGETVTALVTLEECPGCDDMKAALKDQLESGEIIEIPCGDSDEQRLKNFQIMTENDLVSEYPALVEVTKKGKEIEVIELV